MSFFLYDSFFFFTSLSCCPCFFSEVILEENSEFQHVCAGWSEPMNVSDALLLGVKHSLHVLVGERFFIVGCKEAMFMQFALPPPATVSSTDGVLVYSREK